jgi:hypothetical protein
MTTEARAALKQTTLYNRLSDAQLSLLADLTEIKEIRTLSLRARETGNKLTFLTVSSKFG